MLKNNLSDEALSVASLHNKTYPNHVRTFGVLSHTGNFRETTKRELYPNQENPNLMDTVDVIRVSAEFSVTFPGTRKRKCIRWLYIGDASVTIVETGSHWRSD